MRKRWWILLIGSFTVLLLLFLSRRKQPEPSFAGQPVSAWIAQLGFTDHHEDAAKAIQQIGAPAVPYLVLNLECSRRQSLRAKPFYNTLWNRLPSVLRSWMPGPITQDHLNLRGAIVVALASLGPAAAPAVPVLREATQETNQFLHHFAIQTLGAIGEAASNAVPDLVTCLGSGDAVARRSAARALAQIGCSSKEAIRPLETLRNDTNDSVSAFGCLALWRLDPTDEHLLALSNRIKVGDVQVRSALVACLGGMGTSARQSKTMLIERIADGKEPDLLREKAIAALRQIDPEAAAMLGVR